MSKEILLTGGRGALGTEFRNVTENRYNPNILLAPTSTEFDITNLEECRTYLKQHGPLTDVIIHAAAVTNWEYAHAKPEVAFRVNTLGTMNMAQLAKESGARFVLISTDAVFPGTPKAEGYNETDIPHTPTNMYGMTKLVAEWEAKELVPDVLIARLGWLFGPGPQQDTKFVGAILRQLAQGKDVIRAVTDKQGSPTYTLDGVNRIFDLIEQNTKGPRHVVNEGVVSRFEVAEKVVSTWNVPAVVQPVSSDMFPSLVRRPAYSGMTTVYESMRPWQEALVAYRNAHSLEKYK